MTVDSEGELGQVIDRPKILRDATVRRARAEQLRDPHVAPLTDWVERLRRQVPGAGVPDFDPWDGGIEAEVLFLLEAPGRRATGSGFISRNNPDETAKNCFEINVEAGLSRKRTISWNIVPWYIGDGQRIRAATAADVRDGLPWLMELLDFLPRLAVVVLIGRKAQRVSGEIAAHRPDLQQVFSPHPSPMFCNRSPGNRQRILDAFLKVAEIIK